MPLIDEAAIWLWELNPLRELPPPDELLRRRDHMTIWVEAPIWHCPYCSPMERDPVKGFMQDAKGPTTVDWVGRFSPVHGRCRECGVKLRLAEWGEHYPDPVVQESTYGYA